MIGGRGITLVESEALRAGATDDNAGFDDYLKFLADSRKVERLRGKFVDLDVSGRRTIRVLDALGRPLPGAAVAVFSTATKRQVWRGTTYGDGRTPFYPEVAVTDDTIPGWMVEVQAAGCAVRKPWRGDADLELVVPIDAAKPLLQVDVAFVIDTTGSMGDEIRRIQDTLLEVTRRLRALGTEFELRYGAVLYRDVGDIYLTSKHAFTADIEAFDQALRDVRADAGGDGPESMNQGLAVAVDRLEWREGAAKLAFLIADAPPHLDYENDVPYDRSLRAAVARGIKIHSVAASGLDAAGSIVLRQIAQFTRGQFVFIEYGRNLRKTAEGHGVAKPGAANNLDEILFGRVQAEIANWGR